MKIHFLGGAMEIGGSCIYIHAAGKRILLDCGIRQSGSKDPLPDFRTIQEQGGLDAVIISHAHMDHIGTLPIISKAYPGARIYMTAMTADLTRVLLYDSLKIMQYREDEIPHYTEQDVLSMLDRVIPVRYQAPFPLYDKFTLTFYPAGHIAGAACVFLATEEGTLFYSGDFAAFSQRTIEGIHIPKLRPDISIVETTYGNRLHSNRQVEERRLIELVRECVEKRQKILIPAFALGRAQEVLLILRNAIQNKEIPAVPVYVDGMVRDINAMYTRNPTFLKNALGKRILKGNEPFYTKEIQAVAPRQKRDALLEGKEPVILVSSSGMLTGGPSTQYAKQLAPREDACIIITGYQDEESPGRQLLNLLEETKSPILQAGPEEEVPAGHKLTLDGITVPVRCRIEQVGLSAHGDKSEITALLERISSRHIFLVHGNREVILELGKELAAEDYRRHVYLPECGQEYEPVIHTKRKQLSFALPFSMQKNTAFTADDVKSLWNYWQEHYFGKRFSMSQIAFIWHGKQTNDENILQNMQDILLNSPYFSPNTRQLFLIEANPAEDVEKALAPKELTIQDLEPQILELFEGYDYRKIGYHQDTREVLLLFDYPDSVEPAPFQEQAERFLAKTGWAARINPSMNHNAAGSLLYTLFQDRATKISYYAEQKCYAVTLSEISDRDRSLAEVFCKTTGWKLRVNGKLLNSPTGCHDSMRYEQSVQDVLPNDEFVPSDSAAKPLEQNLAFSCIEQSFAGLPHKPEKKSLKHDENGKFLEFSFISPAVGRRYTKEIQEISDQIGWRIRLAEKVNQNALFQTVQMLCAKSGVTPLKTPSYLPDKKMVTVKISDTEKEEKLQEIEERFLEKTGCECHFIRTGL